MKRQITIYESAKNGVTRTLDDVECTTLGELKALLRQKGINYTDMDFVEGVTNTKLLNDNSRLPENIPFKGKIINNLFISLLKKESKISSGIDFMDMSRSDLLHAAKQFAEDIFESFGKNFTQVKSVDLAEFLTNHCGEEEREENNEECSCEEYEEIPLVEAVVTLIKTLKIEDAVVEALSKGEESKSYFSKEDIAEFLSK